MKKENSLFVYVVFLMVLSQTPWAKYVIFFSLPLFLRSFLTSNKSNKVGLKIMKPLLFIILIGLVGGFIQFFYSANIYFFLRDILYFIQAPIFILIGMHLNKSKLEYKQLLKVIVLMQLFWSIYGLGEIIMNPSLLFQLDLKTTYELGLKFSNNVLAFAILYYCKKNNLNLFSNFFENFLLFFFLFGIIISLSRTSYVLTLIILLIPLFNKVRIVYKVYWGMVVLVLFIIFGGLLFKNNTAADERFTFVEKMSHSVQEIVVKDYETKLDIYNNWRGYEAFLGLSKYYRGNLFEIFFGQGFGAAVYTPAWVFDEESSFDVLPIFHNGFITILLKTGIIGLFIFFIFLSILLNFGYKKMNGFKDKEQYLAGLLLQVFVFIILFRSLVVHGIFSATTVPVSLLLLIGANIKIISLGKSIKNRKENEFIGETG